MTTRRLAIAAAMVFGLTACGGSDSGPTGPSDSTPNIAGTWNAVAIVEVNLCPFVVPDDSGQVTITQTGSQVTITFLGFVMSANITTQGLITGTANQTLQIEGFTVNLVRTLQANTTSSNRIAGSVQTDIFIPATGESCTVTVSITFTR